MRLGVFGGSFNPPHLAHLALAEALAEEASLDRVLWVPAATPPHKQAERALAAAPHRLAMTRLATARNERFEVSDIEVSRGGVSYTLDTLRALTRAYPKAELALILGGDSFAGLDAWREPEAILALARLLVYRRPGALAPPLTPEAEAGITFADAPALDVSSTAIRSLIARGRTVRYLVPDAVRAYISEHRLYR